MMSNQNNSSKQLPEKFIVTSAPHLHDNISTAKVMWEVNIALIPALIMALYNFRGKAATVIIMSILGAVLAEALIQKFLLKKPIQIADGSAVLTGLLLAFCVPAALPWWVAFIGGFVAISLGKQVYGGLGQNIFNPAHVARAALLASWPVYMTTWLKPFSGQFDAVTCATPLGVLKETARDPQLMSKIAQEGSNLVSYTMNELQVSFSDLFLGLNFSGSLGETSKLALLAGGLFLLIRGHISWQGPTAMVATVFAGAFIFGGSFDYALFHLLTGGLMIGAIFMITDMVTSPMTGIGQLIFGFGCGAITLLIRMKGGYPEGVCYSILIMNALVPIIDKFTVPTRFGVVNQEVAV